MSQQNGRVEAERVHILRGSGVDLAGSRQNRALCLRFRRRDNVRDAHQCQQSLALVVMFPRDPDRPPGEFLHLFRRAGLLRLFVRLRSLRLALEPFGQLPGLEFGGCPVEDVERFDAVVRDSERAVEHAHQVGRRLAGLVHQLLSIRADRNQETVDAHGPARTRLTAQHVFTLPIRFPADGFQVEGWETRTHPVKSDKILA